MSFQGNLYTFGCSMTSYSWPTWADILGKEFDYYENWGRGSAGNLYIFESVIECLTKNKITSNDTIITVQNDDLLRKNLPINFHKVSPERL